jgi:hypothetical protein
VTYHRRLAVAVFVAVCALLRPAAPATAALDVVVNNAGDDSAAECPHETACTLRKAIELINADPGEGPYTITFDPNVFDIDNPDPIALLDAPLPTIPRADVTIDGTGAAVSIDGSELPEGLRRARLHGRGCRGPACRVAGVRRSLPQR